MLEVFNFDLNVSVFVDRLLKLSISLSVILELIVVTS